ncbi:MAG TPA: VWA domain-containing protein [Solirubrobacteraceae bacterium]|nr:VWA domain-containing protein [Solirubrobacteraceae bacterium]
MSRFTAETYQNEFLPVGAEEVNAVVTVTADGAAGPVRGTGAAAEIVIIDTSGSMGMPGAKLRAAMHATGVAIDNLRDGVAFGVIAGTHRARAIYPHRGLVAASAETRASAKAAVSELKPGGGTAIGKWLALANSTFAAHEEAICHAILLTDGEDRDETPRELARTLEACKGRFQCDCRGIGTDWLVADLREVASALLGTVDIIPEPDALAADFRAMIEAAMSKETGNVALRLWTPQGAAVAFVRQVSPVIEDLTARAADVAAQTVDYPTGAWGREARDYHIAIRVPARAIGDEMLAGRVSLVVDGQVSGQSLIRAIWTDDERLSTQINREVAHYTGQAELAAVIQEGLEARKAGDGDTATLKLGRAVQLAADGGNEATLRLLRNVVDVDDPVTGTVRLRHDVDVAEEMALDTRSTKTVRVSGRRP